MSDDNMDLCECIWGQELAMRRLLSVIRNSQSNCVDNECFDDGFQRQSPDSNMLMMTCVLIVAMFLYYFRPRNTRMNEDPSKPGNSSDHRGAPPSPPSTMS